MKVLALVASGLHLGHVGCYGNEWIATPNLDRLAAEGVVFDQHYADHPETAAARRVWESGRYSFPVTGRADDWPTQQAAGLFSRIQESGVVTSLVTEHRPPLLGIDPAGWKHLRRLAPEAQETISLDRTLEAVIEALDELAAADRWLLKVELATLLPPWEVPEPFRDLYADLADIEPEHTPEDGQGSPARPADEQEDEILLRLQSSYAAAVTYLDDGLGMLFDALRQRNLEDKLLLLLTSDHGQTLGERFPGKESELFLHEESIHIPLIFRLPGQAEAGRRVFALTQPVDLLPTLFEIFGHPTPATQGHSLMPLLHGKVEQVRAYACAGLPFDDAIAWTLRTPEWSLLLPARPEARPVQPKLFVKPDDRWEINDVGHHHPELVERLEQTLYSFVAATQAPGPLVPPELHEASLEQTGKGKAV